MIYFLSHTYIYIPTRQWRVRSIIYCLREDSAYIVAKNYSKYPIEFLLFLPNSYRTSLVYNLSKNKINNHYVIDRFKRGIGLFGKKTVQGKIINIPQDINNYFYSIKQKYN